MTAEETFPAKSGRFATIARELLWRLWLPVVLIVITLPARENVATGFVPIATVVNTPCVIGPTIDPDKRYWLAAPEIPEIRNPPGVVSNEERISTSAAPASIKAGCAGG